MRRAAWMAAWMAACGDRVDLVAPEDAGQDASVTASANCVQSATPVLYGGSRITLGEERCLPSRFTSRSTFEGERIDCVVREVPAPGLTLTCDPAHGRSASDDGSCLVAQLPARASGAPASAGHGFFVRRNEGMCATKIEFTEGDAPGAGAYPTVECVHQQQVPKPARVIPVCRLPVGARCTTTPQGGLPCSVSPAGCHRGTEVLLEAGGMECGSGLCLAYRYDELSDRSGAQRDRVACTCRCDVPAALRASVDPRTLCACGAGFTCRPLVNSLFGPGLEGSYCIRSSIL